MRGLGSLVTPYQTTGDAGSSGTSTSSTTALVAHFTATQPLPKPPRACADVPRVRVPGNNVTSWRSCGGSDAVCVWSTFVWIRGDDRIQLCMGRKPRHDRWPLLAV
eukprot:368931-Rhodomonas_salina.1